MPQTVQILWLKPEDYPRFREIFDDVDDTYEEWRARMERKMPEFIKRGFDLERVLVDPDELVEWCRTQGRKVNAEARTAYPIWLAIQRDRKG